MLIKVFSKSFYGKRKVLEIFNFCSKQKYLKNFNFWTSILVPLTFLVLNHVILWCANFSWQEAIVQPEFIFDSPSILSFDLMWFLGSKGGKCAKKWTEMSQNWKKECFWILVGFVIKWKIGKLILPKKICKKIIKYTKIKISLFDGFKLK